MRLVSSYPALLLTALAGANPPKQQLRLSYCTLINTYTLHAYRYRPLTTTTHSVDTLISIFIGTYRQTQHGY